MELLLVAILILYVGYVQPATQCYYGDGKHYWGSVSVTKNNKICQRWDTDSPHTVSGTGDLAKKDSSYPDGSRSASGNHCRNPDGEDGGPWCYTTDPNTRWEYCDIQKCKVQYKSLGCWGDSKDRAIAGNFKYISTIMDCAKWAQSLGFTLFAVQYGSECWTGAEALKKTNNVENYKKYGKSTKCANGRGGGYANSVYQITSKMPPKTCDKCKNGGMCAYVGGCECPEGVYGKSCEFTNKECEAKDPNSHVATDYLGTYTGCGCKKGYKLDTDTKLCQACGPPAARKWCELSCESSMCKYPGPDPKCPLLKYGGKTGLTDADKQAVLDAHNKYRRDVAAGKVKGLPAAKERMPDLKWDEDMAELAQRWVTQCKLEHDHGRATTKFSYVGQNSYAYSQSWKPTWSNKLQPADAMAWAVPAWYDEVNGYVNNSCTPDVFKSCVNPVTKNWTTVGHFTQVIWQDTTHVGCGYAWFDVGTGAKFPYIVYVTCNYGNGGNMLGSPVYL